MVSIEKVVFFVDYYDDKFCDIDVVVWFVYDVDDIKYFFWLVKMVCLYFVFVIVYFCGCFNGYDGSLMGGLNGMKLY